MRVAPLLLVLLAAAAARAPPVPAAPLAPPALLVLRLACAARDPAYFTADGLRAYAHTVNKSLPWREFSILSYNETCGRDWRTSVVRSVARALASGGAALLALPALRPPHPRLLPALAHAAHHHRAPFLHAPDLLEFLSAALLTGNTSEVVLAARAAWALAANNHRAKLVLRGAGVSSGVQSALQRLQRSSSEEAQRALQLLTYTNHVLHAT